MRHAVALAAVATASARRRRSQSATHLKSSTEEAVPRTNKPSAAMPEIPAGLAEPGLKVPKTAWKWPRQWPYGEMGLRSPRARKRRLSTVRRSSTTTPKKNVQSPSGDASGIWCWKSYWRSTAPVRARRTFPRKVGRNCGLPLNLSRALMLLRCLVMLHYLILIRSFDAVVLASAAELLTDPRGTFRELWRVPAWWEELLLLLSSSARFSPAAHAAQQTQTWKDYNDAQRLWVVGSYFHFSAGAPAAAMIADGEQIATTMWGAGWRALRGYDYLDAAEDAGKDIATKVGDMAKKATSSKTPLFVVQADRAYDVSSSSASAGARMDAALWNAASMDEDDKRMCATRLMECLERYEPNDEMRRAALGREGRGQPAAALRDAEADGRRHCLAFT